MRGTQLLRCSESNASPAIPRLTEPAPSRTEATSLFCVWETEDNDNATEQTAPQPVLLCRE